MKILFATGGTAGHINPALAVASYIREKYPDSEILFVGTADQTQALISKPSRFQDFAVHLHQKQSCIISKPFVS